MVWLEGPLYHVWEAGILAFTCHDGGWSLQKSEGVEFEANG